ncbi:hypothetical protein DICVIV_00649 [Dictyocaulus viviparus]|uniref:S1 motif domain-containing protein n=1 Tax=Dictyocaulus viviparus TaxID=29172 RepID=A0A0D8YER9_DICVI|nr:hypothetical protein DICVIV_00649 [Dictyocaulus viviparus]
MPTQIKRSYPDKKLTKKLEGDRSSLKRRKPNLGLRTKSVKNLCTYTGVVIGPWTYGDYREYARLAVEIRLPGGHKGRLHVSELPSHLLSKSTCPLETFLKGNQRKSVVVKIIKFIRIKHNHTKVRIAELTMNETKISETRKKSTAVDFQTKFIPGEIIRAFVSPYQNKKKKIRVEINPLWCGQVYTEASSDDLKVCSHSLFVCMETQITCGSKLFLHYHFIHSCFYFDSFLVVE